MSCYLQIWHTDNVMLLADITQVEGHVLLLADMTHVLLLADMTQEEWNVLLLADIAKVGHVLLLADQEKKMSCYFYIDYIA